MSIFNEALDDEAAVANKLTCELCGYVASEPKVLGTHKRHKHGIAGQSDSAQHRQKLVAKAKRRQQASMLGGTIIDTVLAYMKANRGPHRLDDIRAELDLELKQVTNALNKAKLNGLPVGSDGAGNWRWTEGLEVRASSKPPRTQISRELVPVEEEVPKANGRPHRSYASVDMTDLDLLDDGEGGLWLATRIK